MSTHASPGRVRRLVSALRWAGAGRMVARTAGFNMIGTVAAGLGGIILARTVGPTVRGEYAAITAWFAVAVIVGQMGQPAAVCFYVARDRQRAPQYLATSRAMLLTTGVLASVAGILLAPVLARGRPEVVEGYRIAFSAAIVAFTGTSYLYSLQAWDLRRWNVAWITQPVLHVTTIGVLWWLQLLTLRNALIVMGATSAVQFVWAYYYCRTTKLAPGHATTRLIRPLAAYGLAQIAALTPATLNSLLDQLVLSQTVAAADLGRYAIAVSLTSLPIPLVAAIGNVAFPRLAARRAFTNQTRKMQLHAIVGSACLAAALLAPLAASAYWIVPLIFGAAYTGVVPLLWILTPGAMFLACGQVTGDLLRGRNHPTSVAWAQGFAAVITVVLLVVLLPAIGVTGAAIASTVAYGVALVAMVRSLWRLPRHARSKQWAPETPEIAIAEQ